MILQVIFCSFGFQNAWALNGLTQAKNSDNEILQRFGDLWHQARNNELNAWKKTKRCFSVGYSTRPIST